MAQDSKVKRRLRRLKRENTLLFRQQVTMQDQMQQLANLVVKSQKDWQDLQATLEAEEQKSALTVTRVEDETEQTMTLSNGSTITSGPVDADDPGVYEAAFGDLSINETEAVSDDSPAS